MKKTLVASLALLAGMGSAHAQDLRGVPVTERPRPDFDAVGMRAGAFLVRPRLTLTGAYDDNIFAQDRNTDDDYVLVATPSVVIASDWNRNSLQLRASAEIGRYSDFDSEDYEDYNLGADFRLDVTEGDFISVTADYRREHDERGSPNDAGGREPTEYDLLFGRLSYERTGRRVTLRLGSTYNEYDYDDVPGIGTAIIDQDFRDREEYTLATRLGYEFRPGVFVFVQGGLDDRSYDNGVRDSEGYQIDGGFSFDLGGVTTGELFAGYRERQYDNTAFEDTDGFSFGGNVLWNPSALTSVQIRLINAINESTTTGASGYTSRGLSVQADHELRRNILIGGSVSYTENDYEGVDRLEDLWTAGANVDYLLNRNLRVGIGYRLSTRDVNRVNEDYTRNVFTISLRGAI